MDDISRAKGEALAFFLVKEILRHRKDIDRAYADIHVLEKKGIRIPDFSEIDPDAWIEP